MHLSPQISENRKQNAANDKSQPGRAVIAGFQYKYAGQQTTDSQKIIGDKVLNAQKRAENKDSAEQGSEERGHDKWLRTLIMWSTSYA